MSFKITVEKLTQKTEQDYPKSEKMYEQIVEKLDVIAVISAVNKSLDTNNN